MNARPHPVADRRLVSLDILRGITVIGMVLVNSMAGMEGGAKAHVFPLLLHSRWNGLSIADLVFPAFLMMVGVSIPLAFRDPSSARFAAHRHDIARRTMRLVLLGLFLSNLYWCMKFSVAPFRAFGVLQRIGLVYGACATLYLVTSRRSRTVLIIILLVGYWPLAMLHPIDGGLTDIWQRGQNFVSSVDRVVLGTHLYVKGPYGYDPEGLLGTIPAIAQGLIGVAIGEFLLKNGANSVRRVALAGGAMTVVGLGWGLMFPIIKDIWSSSFVLVTSGLTTMLLVLVYALVDRRSDDTQTARGPITLFFTAFGINAITAYVVHELSGNVPLWDVFMLPYKLLRPSVGDALASFAPIVLYIAAIWSIVAYLQRRRWIIKI